MNNPRSIVFLIAKLCIGGSEKKAIKLSNHLSRNGYRTGFVFFHGDESMLESIDDGVTVYTPKQQGKLDIKSMLRYRRFVRSQQYSCVVSMGLYAGALHTVCMIGVRCRPKEVVSLNMSVPTSKVRRRMSFYRALISRSHIIFGAAYQRQVWQEKYGFFPHRAEIIYNGVDSSYFDASICKERNLRDHHGISRNDFVLGVVAALRPEKAIGDLIAAAAHLRNQGLSVKVMVVGNGVELLRLKQEAIDQQMQEHSIFLGALIDVRPALCAMDIFVLPSVAVETFSNAALEAMAMGLPVVLSDIGGSREMISAGENGFVFQPGNILELSQTIEKIIRTDMIQAMGDASRRLVKERFALQAMVSGYQRIIDTTQ